MEYFAGLDVSLRSCALCIVDGRGKVVHARELTVNCTSSDNLGRLSGFRIGGSGPSLIEIMRFQFRG
ncbi:hypothetical protein N5A93_16095, partial [Roseovarius sp. EGI FJ00037]|nr:hypothetical protein [Roseovarius sp. EGI FJ00037]